VFELLKKHLYLEVSARAKIDLDDYIFGSQNRFYQGIPVAVSGDVMSHVSCISQPLAQAARVVVFAAGDCYVLR
jgi:hypothetical protein